MNITCPYCHSENVSRETAQSGSANSFSSMAGAGIGASLAKSDLAQVQEIQQGLQRSVRVVT